MDLRKKQSTSNNFVSYFKENFEKEDKENKLHDCFNETMINSTEIKSMIYNLTNKVECSQDFVDMIMKNSKVTIRNKTGKSEGSLSFISKKGKKILSIIEIYTLRDKLQLKKAENSIKSNEILKAINEDFSVVLQNITKIIEITKKLKEKGINKEIIFEIYIEKGKASYNKILIDELIITLDSR